MAQHLEARVERDLHRSVLARIVDEQRPVGDRGVERVGYLLDGCLGVVRREHDVDLAGAAAAVVNAGVLGLLRVQFVSEHDVFVTQRERELARSQPLVRGQPLEWALQRAGPLGEARHPAAGAERPASGTSVEITSPREASSSSTVRRGSRQR